MSGKQCRKLRKMLGFKKQETKEYVIAKQKDKITYIEHPITGSIETQTTKKNMLVNKNGYSYRKAKKELKKLNVCISKIQLKNNKEETSDE